MQISPLLRVALSLCASASGLTAWAQTAPLNSDATLATTVPAAAQFAFFVGQERSAKRYRWLAHTMSAKGAYGKDCEHNQGQLPLVSFEDAAVPNHYPPSIQKAMNDPKQIAAAGYDTRMIALRHAFPKLQGQVYGFDAQGKRTGTLTLNNDLLNIRIHGVNVCLAAHLPDAMVSPDQRATIARDKRYDKAVQALFHGSQDSTYSLARRTVVFSNDPVDVPHIPQGTPAPADIAAKLNAQLKAKLSRDLERERQTAHAALDRWITPAVRDSEMKAFAQRRTDGQLHTPAQILEYYETGIRMGQYTLDKLPPNIDAIFAPCPVTQYPLSAKASRMLYRLACTERWFGFYEQTQTGELVLVRTTDTRSTKQKQAGKEPAIFSSGFSNFALHAWAEPYFYHWRQRWIDGQGKRNAIANPNAPQYTVGMTADNVDSPLYTFNGVYDLMPERALPVAQVYLSSREYAEAPLVLIGFEPGEKPGDTWKQRKQTWSSPWVE